MSHVTIDEFVHALMGDNTISGFSLYYDNDTKTCHVSVDFGDDVDITAHDTFPRLAVRKVYALYQRIIDSGLGASMASEASSVNYAGQETHPAFADAKACFGLSVDDVSVDDAGFSVEDVLS